jgi:hypothetical protein
MLETIRQYDYLAVLDIQCNKNLPGFMIQPGSSGVYASESIRYCIQLMKYNVIKIVWYDLLLDDLVFLVVVLALR